MTNSLTRIQRENVEGMVAVYRAALANNAKCGDFICIIGKMSDRISQLKKEVELKMNKWTDEKNGRRCDLINKEIGRTITPDEREELNKLQDEISEYVRLDRGYQAANELRVGRNRLAEVIGRDPSGEWTDGEGDTWYDSFLPDQSLEQGMEVIKYLEIAIWDLHQYENDCKAVLTKNWTDVQIISTGSTPALALFNALLEWCEMEGL